jgi:hypothetical protein
LTRPLRLSLVVVGLAAAVWGAACVTGGWLGFAPRHETGTFSNTQGTGTFEIYRDGGEIYGMAAFLGGLGLFALGAYTTPRTLRAASIVLGGSGVLYGAASLTGGWLGYPPRLAAHGPLGHVTGTDLSSVLPGSGGAAGIALTVLGLAFVALGAWPRRRREATS